MNLAQLIGLGVFPPITLRETLGAKLRRLARAAEINNPLILNPWRNVAAWVTGTAYASGTVVSNAGGWYVATGAGTSGATAPTHTNGQAVTDGAVLWTYLGPAPITADEAGAPSYSSSTSAPSSPNNIAIYPATYPSLYRIYGGYGETVSATNWYPYVGDAKAATREYGQGIRIACVTDSPVITIPVPGGSPAPRVLIDGRYLSMACLPRSASLTYHTLTFAGLRRNRLIEIEGPKDQWAFQGVVINNASMIRPPSTENDIRAVFAGDSLFDGSGYGPWVAGNTVPNRIARWLGWTDPWNLSHGGTGWINDAGASYYTYGQRVAQAVALSPDILVFGCPTNDTGYTAAAVTAAVKAALQAARSAGYLKPIIVLGAWPRNDANVATTEDAVLAGVTQAADPLGLTTFIPLFRAPFLPIVAGSWNNSAFSSIDNSAMAIGGDGTHPAEIGTGILSDYVAREIKRLALPNIR
ncbi:hypothetical protein C3941_23775 [Kaistia algarum]|uniref:SGNH/GDSL hydrolase family protein n=1 Tax=Kaistia algarum TaxID=2083279 RepID=UPI000CE87A2F|nr:SGNH/GDSL hydrolase family protein [Kaistia algarum]MCX5513411.1 SGNH/GDSL hydrolase family protein [Kaistia algarum]PPE77418.1 hypothetical protein C3941_23775 [Kaistia algarum]